MQPITVLSLFDGMSCGRLALERADIPVADYRASEIDKYAIQVSNNNRDDVYHLGDVQGLDQLYLFFLHYTMEKLLKLLNEYLGQTNIVVIEQEIEGRRDIFFENEDGFHAEEAEIISKKFGFIQCLVENDKIKEPLPQVLKDIDVVGSDTITGVDVYSTTDSLLMLLAIIDDPIEFLISMLK